MTLYFKYANVAVQTTRRHSSAFNSLLPAVLSKFNGNRHAPCRHRAAGTRFLTVPEAFHGNLEQPNVYGVTRTLPDSLMTVVL